MNDEFIREELIIGKDNLNKLINSRVLVFGCGGVGGYAIEALARSGIGTIGVVDNDKVAISNINRQIIALHSNIGKYKVDVIEERIKDINPNCNVIKYNKFYLPENRLEFDLENYDYIIDCIDTITAKIDIIVRANELNIPIISSMGTGNKLDPLKLEIADIYKTSVCPLARVMRYELKKRNIKKLKVIYSKEEPIKTNIIDDETKKMIPGSISFVPSTAGLILASYVIKDLIGK